MCKSGRRAASFAGLELSSSMARAGAGESAAAGCKMSDDADRRDSGARGGNREKDKNYGPEATDLKRIKP